MDLSSIQPLLNWLTANPQWVAICILFISFLESLAIVGIIVPGVLLLFGASAVAGGGTLTLLPTLLSAFVGAILGDCISFFIGKLSQHHVRNIWPFRKYPRWIDNGELFFNRHGVKSIFIGRFIGPIRPVLPLVAGMLNMPSFRFVSINFISALGWAPLYVLPGYLFGLSLQKSLTLPNGLTDLGLVLLSITIILLITLYLFHSHLQANTPLYQAIETWAKRQHKIRIVYYWLAGGDNHSSACPVIFPLFLVLLALSSLFTLLLMVIIINNTAFLTQLNQQIIEYFVSIQHPLLNHLCQHLVRLSEPNFIRGLVVIFTGWLLIKKHTYTAINLITALLISELLIIITWHNIQLTEITLTSGLIVAFVAQRIEVKQRYWVYGLAWLPIILASLAGLYLKTLSITDLVIGILIGIILCCAVSINVNRHNQHSAIIGASFWVTVALALLWVVFYIGIKIF